MLILLAVLSPFNPPAVIEGAPVFVTLSAWNGPGGAIETIEVAQMSSRTGASPLWFRRSHSPDGKPFQISEFTTSLSCPNAASSFSALHKLEMPTPRIPEPSTRHSSGSVTRYALEKRAAYPDGTQATSTVISGSASPLGKSAVTFLAALRACWTRQVPRGLE